MDGFLKRDDVEGFWDGVTRGTADSQQTGYLTPDWPDALGINRFRGEWNQVSRWLRRYRVARDACLDVGCGTGIWLEHLAPRFERAEGVDISEEMVGRARALLEARGVTHATVRCASVVDLAAEAQHRYDLIFVGGVLMYINDEDLAEVIQSLRAMLADGGLLVVRETTHRGSTRYRDTPLLPGLLADPDAERRPYYAIYRTPRVIRDALAANGLQVRTWGANRHYKVSDLTEGQLWAVNKLLRGKLRGDRARAEKWARRLHRMRWLTTLPYYYVCHATRLPAWRMENHWFVCSRSIA